MGLDGNKDKIQKGLSVVVRHGPEDLQLHWSGPSAPHSLLLGLMPNPHHVQEGCGSQWCLGVVWGVTPVITLEDCSRIVSYNPQTLAALHGINNTTKDWNHSATCRGHISWCTRQFANNTNHCVMRWTDGRN
jgi:hypothetical protein